MKKYILLAGVALATMTASNVMAAISTYSDVNVKANIEKLTHRTCTDLDFGTIKILPSASLAAGAASTEAKVVLDYDGTTTSGATVDNGGFGILSVTGASVAKCISNSPIAISGYPESVTLKNGDSTLTVSDIGEYEEYDNGNIYGITATLTIPDVITVEEGEYTGSFTVYYAN